MSMTDQTEIPDITDRLRVGYQSMHIGGCQGCADNLMEEAADEISQLRSEVSNAWKTLEGSGFPPEACGWPHRDMRGILPEAIDCAIDCLLRQRSDLLAEVIELRKLRNLT